MSLIKLVYSKKQLIALSLFFAMIAVMDAASIQNGLPLWAMALIVLWSLPWKGIALWKAAQLSHKKWFIVLLVINSLAILDIIYIYFVARKYTVETIETEEK